MKDFTLYPDALLACLPHVSGQSRGDTFRPILEGVFLDKCGAVIATDGKSLGVWRLGHTAPEDVILQLDPKRFATWARKVKKHRTLDPVFTVQVQGVHTAIISHGGESVSVRVVEGPFPNYLQVFPGSSAEWVARSFYSFRPDYLERFAWAESVILSGPSAAGKAIVVRANDSNGEAVKNFVGLLMPCTSPHWAPSKRDAGTSKESEPKLGPDFLPGDMAMWVQR